LNTKFSLSQHLDLRLAYARGFRSPSLRELYFNFFDANHQIIGNPDLKAETSHSFTGSLAWVRTNKQQTTYTATATGFYNDIKNLIDYALSPNNSNLFILTNVSDSKTRGANLQGTVTHKGLSASAGASYTGFYNQYSEVDESLDYIQWSPEITASIGYSFSKIGLDANFFYKYTGKRPFYVTDGSIITLARQNCYHWGDLTVNKKLAGLFIVSAGIHNLFDATRVSSTRSGSGTHASDGGRIVGYGRSFFAGLVFNWDKKIK
jgi:outer membrane receptor for ferrienterochelin and colicins